MSSIILVYHELMVAVFITKSTKTAKLTDYHHFEKILNDQMKLPPSQTEISHISIL